jgi:ethanolamine ammonia-lyase small subunit
LGVALVSKLPDRFDVLSATTPARISLSRAGASPTTKERLSFAVDHSLARDAVRRSLDTEALSRDLVAIGVESRVVRSRAATFEDHLLHPEDGRRIDPADIVSLGGPVETVVVVADGLSAGAVQRYSPRLLQALGGVPQVVIVRHGRVAIGDEIGSLLQATFAIVLIGERPGLSAAESLGIYVTYNPRIGRTDSERNCISNVRDGGTPPEVAAQQLGELLVLARAARRTGVRGREVE